MGKMLIDDESQKVVNWICSDLDNHLPVYADLCKKVFKEKDIVGVGVSLHVNDNYIYLYTEDKSEMLIAFVSRSDIGIVDDNDKWRKRTQKELEEFWSQEGNFDIPTMFEGYLHTDLDVKDTLLSYDYIKSHVRDVRIDEILL